MILSGFARNRLGCPEQLTLAGGSPGTSKSHIQGNSLCCPGFSLEKRDRAPVPVAFAWQAQMAGQGKGLEPGWEGKHLFCSTTGFPK